MNNWRYGNMRLNLGGYMGLVGPLDTVWADGRSVTVYPNGEVIENASGNYVRKPDYPFTYSPPEKTDEELNLKHALFQAGIAVLAGLVLYGLHKYIKG